MQFIRRFARRILTAAGLTAAVVASFFALAGSVSLAQTGAAPVMTSGPTASSITDDSAVIRWTTDVESTTVVEFGTSEALGQTYRKIIPIEDTEVTETTHAMTLTPLQARTTYFFRASSSTSGGKTASGTFSFTTTGAVCGADAWTCGDWGACGKATDGSYGQTRSCTVSPSCADAGVPKPATSQSCTPPCTEDKWTCTDWQACSAAGSQVRTCTMTTECPTASTPKPPTSQSCKRPCATSDWNCGDWSVCDKESQKRSCALPTTCEGTAPKPAETQRCTMPAPQPPKLPACTDRDWTCGDWSACPADGAAGASRRDCTRGEQCDPGNGSAERTRSEVRDCPPAKLEAEKTPPAPDVNAPLPPDAPPSPPSSPLPPNAMLGGTGEASSLQAECAANNVSPSECAAWMAAKYGDRTCAENGIFSKESCGDFLRKSNDGVIPGCEGKTEAECKEITARMMAGYMPGDMRDEVDAMIGTKKAGEIFDALGDAAPDVLAARPSIKDAVIWWPSLRADGQETAPGMLVVDTDKDRLPDDVERRIGTDPNTPDAKVAREVLKKYFETGDKPTEAQKESRKELEKFFETGDIPTQDEARRALRAFFGPGTTPPDNLTAVDAAFILGMSVGQPMGSGETDETFTVDVTSMPDAVGGITLHGHAASNAVVFLYIYSYVPMVLTTTADANGNYQYDIADNVVDGSHTAYVAVIDGNGDVATKSGARSFFVKTALAVSESDFLAADAKLTPTGTASKATSFYLYGAAALVVAALVVAAFVMRGTGKHKGAASTVPPKQPTQ